MALYGKNMVKMEEEDDMDVEALRLAALQTLRKGSVKPEIPVVGAVSSVGSHVPGLPLHRGRGPRLMARGRGIHQRIFHGTNKNFRNFGRSNCSSPGFFPNRPTANSNLITIVPTIPDSTHASLDIKTEGISHLVPKPEPSNLVTPVKDVAEQEKVPAKFRRVDDSNSDDSEEESDKESSDKDEKKRGGSLSDGDASSEEDRQSERESDEESEKDADVVNLQPEEEGEDSLERLMRELEEEISDTPKDKKPVESPIPMLGKSKQDKASMKKEKKEKRRKDKSQAKGPPAVDEAPTSAPALPTDSPHRSPRARPRPRSRSPRLPLIRKTESRSPPARPWSPRRPLSPDRLRIKVRSRSRSRSRTRSPFKSPRRSPSRYLHRLPSPGRLQPLRSRSRSPRRLHFRSKSRSPGRGFGYLRRSRTRSRSAPRVVRRSPSPVRRSRSRSPGGRLYAPRSRSRSLSPRGPYKGRRSPSPYSKKLSPRRRSISPRRRSPSPVWSGPHSAPRRSRSPGRSALPLPPARLRSPYLARRSRSPLPRRYSPARGYRSPRRSPHYGSVSPRGPGLRRLSPVPAPAAGSAQSARRSASPASLPSRRTRSRSHSHSDSLSLSPSPERQPAHRSRKSQPLRENPVEAKRPQADLRNILPKRREISKDEGKGSVASTEELSKREKRERKKIKKEKIKKRAGSSHDVDPVLEARRRKFESSKPVEVTVKKIRLRNATSEVADESGSEVDEGILDRELIGGVDLLWSDEEDENTQDSSNQDNVQFKRTFNLPSSSSGKENIPDDGSKMCEEPTITSSSLQAKQQSDESRDSGPDEYEDSYESEGELPDVDSGKSSHEILPKTNRELKEFILSQAKGKSIAVKSSKASEIEAIRSKVSDLDDLRAELSRRRAERLTKVNVAPETLPRRLLQSALQSVGVKPSLSTRSRKRIRSPCDHDKDSEGRVLERKLSADNITIPKVESPKESRSKSTGKIPVHMRLGMGSRGDECSSKVKLKRNITLGRKKQV